MKKMLFFASAVFLILSVAACSKETGPEGPAGEQGVAGMDGNMIHHGNAAPAGSLGNVGDFYIDKQNGNLYGPKDASGWGEAVSMKGSAGETGRDGSQFLSGTASTPGAGLGKPGDFYFNTTNSTLFGPKNTDNTWPAGVSLKGLKGDKGDKGAPGNANVKKYTFVVNADDWIAAHYGNSNVHHTFKVPPSLTGGVDIGDSQYVALTYARPEGIGYEEKKPLPYVFGIQNNYGIRLELLPSRNSFSMSKTTNGWNSLEVPLNERPTIVKFDIFMIETGVLNALKGKIDINDHDAIARYFKIN